MKNLNKLINEVNGSMSIEDMRLTQDDKDRIRRCAGNEKLVEQVIADLVKKYAQKDD